MPILHPRPSSVHHAPSSKILHLQFNPVTRDSNSLTLSDTVAIHRRAPDCAGRALMKLREMRYIFVDHSCLVLVSCARLAGADTGGGTSGRPHGTWLYRVPVRYSAWDQNGCIFHGFMHNSLLRNTKVPILKGER